MLPSRFYISTIVNFVAVVEEDKTKLIDIDDECKKFEKNVDDFVLGFSRIVNNKGNFVNVDVSTLRTSTYSYEPPSPRSH